MTLAGSASRRVGLVIAIVVIVVGAIAPAARAHGGEVVYSGEVGQFYVEITDRVVETGEGLLYTMIVRDPATELPVDGANVQVTATAGDRQVGPKQATYFGNQYQVLIPDPGVASWQVEVLIEADVGIERFQHEIAGVGGGGDWTRWVPVLLASVGALVIIARLLTRRRRRGADAPTANAATPH